MDKVAFTFYTPNIVPYFTFGFPFKLDEPLEFKYGTSIHVLYYLCM